MGRITWRSGKIGLRFEKRIGRNHLGRETAVKASSVDRSFSMGKLSKKTWGICVPGKYGEAVPKIEPEPLDETNEKRMAGFPSRHGRSAQNKNWRRWRKMKKRKLNYWQSSTLTAGQSCRAFWRSMGRRFTILEAIVWDFQHKEERQRLFEKDTEKNSFICQTALPRLVTAPRKSFAANTKVSKAKIKQTHPPPRNPARASDSIPTGIGISGIRESGKCRPLSGYSNQNGRGWKPQGIHLGQKGRPNQRIYDWRNYPENARTPEAAKAREKYLLHAIIRWQKHSYPDWWWCKSWKCCGRLQKDGYKPAAIIESSPNNFQCILTIP